jgi:tRNA (guanine-N7-)-methyltransferase
VNILLENLPGHSLNTIYVFFPDPWPKKRHKKRRLLNNVFIAQLHKKLVPGGSLIMASDDADYQEFIQEETAKLQEFTLKEITDPPRTKYCRKADREGRTSKMFVYKAT